MPVTASQLYSPSFRKALMMWRKDWCLSYSAVVSFRTDYEGSTLREHLGLPRPSNRFFDGS